MAPNNNEEDQDLEVSWEDIDWEALPWEALSRHIAKDPAASTWIKTALALALQRDPVDAANDADVLQELLSKRADAIAQENLKNLRSFPGKRTAT